MKSLRFFAAGVLVLALLPGCGSSDDEERRVADAPRKESDGPPQGELDRRPRQKSEARRGARVEARRAPRRGPGRVSQPGPEQARGPAADRRGPGGGPPARVHPAAGRYRYSQTGYEDFCQGATCTRERLPGSQTMDVRRLGGTANRPTIETVARGSRYRTIRTVGAYGRDKALISAVSFRVNYQGLSYSRAYRPRPAIVSLRFPLSVGRRWSGQWDAATSGSYAVRVAGREVVRAAGRRIQAYKVETTTSLRGELRGSVDVTAWVDSRTKAIVRMAGAIDVTSALGRYVSKFHALLASAPGY